MNNSNDIKGRKEELRTFCFYKVLTLYVKLYTILCHLKVDLD